MATTKRKTQRSDPNTSIEAFSGQLGMFQLASANSGGDFNRDEFRRVMLRAFLWFSHDPGFEDLHQAATAAMPVLAGYMMDRRTRDEDTSSVDEVLSLLATYLDEAALSLPPTREATNVVSMGLYGVAEALDQRAKTILGVSPLVRRKQDSLLKRKSTTASLRKLLKASDGTKIRTLLHRFMDLKVAKNSVYNLVRLNGEHVLPEIEAHIFELHPADQDYLLHGLDAFPKSKLVLGFYKRFLAKNRHASLAEQVKKYARRVKAGMRTTGWEL